MIDALEIIIPIFIYIAIAGFTSKLLISVHDQKEAFDNFEYYLAGFIFPLIIIYYLLYKPFQLLGEYVGDKIIRRKLRRLQEQKRIRIELEQAQQEVEEILHQDSMKAIHQ
jgi:hypothetical protein